MSTIWIRGLGNCISCKIWTFKNKDLLWYPNSHIKSNFGIKYLWQQLEKIRCLKLTFQPVDLNKRSPGWVRHLILKYKVESLKEDSWHQLLTSKFLCSYVRTHSCTCAHTNILVHITHRDTHMNRNVIWCYQVNLLHKSTGSSVKN